MSMMSDRLLPSACEVDVTNDDTSMYTLQLAAGSPAALVDWNNYRKRPTSASCSIAATGPKASCPTPV